MESKSFVTLTSSYRSFLSDADDILTNHNIDKTSTLGKINKFYDDIHNILGNYEMQISDINHLLTNYDKPNDVINKLKKVVSLRNYLVITMGMKNPKWTTFIDKLKERYNINTKRLTDKMFADVINELKC